MANIFNVLKNTDLLKDQTVATAGGDNAYTPPEEGMAKARLVAYVETGKHEKTFKGVPSIKDTVQLTFELSGKKWEPRDVNGTKIPQRITIRETLSLSSKARFYALFLKMRDGREDITHMAQMLGEAFLIRIHHRKYEVTVDGKKVERVAAECMKDKAWTIQPPVMEVPRMEDDGDGNMVPSGDFDRKPVSVAEPLSDLRLFIWSLADKEQWDSLYIEPGNGERSNNVFQDLICKAVNFAGSPAEAAASGSHALLASLSGDKQEGKPAPQGDDEVVVESTTDAASKKAAAATKKVATKQPVVEDDLDDLSDIE